MSVIEQVTERCVVLNYGRKIAEGSYREVAADRQVQEAYLGTGMRMGEGLIVERISTAYDRADVLREVSLTVEPGTITCLLGSNGAGKTTLIRSILGLTPPRSRQDQLRGQGAHRPAAPIGWSPPASPASPRAARCSRSSRSRTTCGSAAIGRRSEQVVARADRRGLSSCSRSCASARGQLAGTMSGGEQAMVSIGRGLMCAPKLLLIDEPSLGLSPIYVKQNFAIIRQIRERGVTVFLVEQNVHQTLAIADYGYVLAKGRVVAAGPPATLAQNAEVHQAYFG